MKLLDPPQPEPPEGTFLQPDRRWHALLGAVPTTWDFIECERQISILKQEARDLEESHRVQREAAAWQAAQPPPPPTVEERVAALERRVADLEVPASKRRSRRAA